jgi:ribosomal subunit interface protein
MNTRYLLNGLKLNKKEENYLEKKIAKIDKFFKECKNPDELRLEIDVKQDKKTFWTIELMLKTPKRLFRAEKREKELTVATDEAIDALMEQLRRHKDRMASIKKNNNNNKDV